MAESRKDGYTTSYDSPDGKKVSITTFDNDIEQRTHQVDDVGTVTTSTKYAPPTEGKGAKLREWNTQKSYDALLEQAQNYQNQMREGAANSSSENPPSSQERVGGYTSAAEVITILSKLRETGVNLNQVFDDPEMLTKITNRIAAELDSGTDTAGRKREHEQANNFKEKIIFNNNQFIIFKRVYDDGKTTYVKQAKSNEASHALYNEAKILLQLNGQDGFPTLITDMPVGLTDEQPHIEISAPHGITLKEITPHLSSEQKKALIGSILKKTDDVARLGITLGDLLNENNILVSLDEDNSMSIAIANFSNGTVIDNPDRVIGDTADVTNTRLERANLANANSSEIISIVKNLLESRAQ